MKKLPIILMCLFVLTTIPQVQAQVKLGKKLENKLKKRTSKKIDKGMEDGLDEVEEGLEEGVKGEGANDQETIADGTKQPEEIDRIQTTAGNNNPNTNFIDMNNTVFYDDFDNERPTEFPSKWIQIKGALQNNQVSVRGKQDGVIETISSNTLIKPAIKGDNYLGDEFKIEMKVYFHEKGNEAYVIDLKNSNSVHGSHEMRVSGGVMWSGSDPISRMPGVAKPGWHTFQISFNKGYMKGYLDGVMLVNDPDISRANVSKKEFTHLELFILSPSLTKTPPLRQMITHFAIGGKGHPLYDRLSSDEGLVEHINFKVNSYLIQESSYSILDKIAKVLKEYPAAEITIAGHTDAEGSKESNQVLGLKRAESVKKYLASKDIQSERMTTLSYGEEKPIDTSNTEEAYAQNRRVVFKLQQ